MLIHMIAALSLDSNLPVTFAVPSTDGVIVHGQADRPEVSSIGAVVMVAGTGPFDRDVMFGEPGGEPTPVFLDMARRLNARGITAIRYDKRGVRFRAEPGRRLDRIEAVTATTDRMRDDLGAVYNWTRASDGLGAQCVAFFGHSEGFAHIGRLAATGAPAPAAVVGMGALLTDPVRNFRWNLAERDSWSLRALDTDGDGVTTNEEVRSGLSSTPAAVNGVIEPYLAPDGVWTAEDIADLDRRWNDLYPALRAQALAAPDEGPWPNAEQPLGSMQWSKSWYLDEVPVARNLALWDTPVIAHLGERDSQTHPALQQEAGARFLGERLKIVVHAGLGHTLGLHPTYGPMQADAADAMADELYLALQRCQFAS